jgi:uncharacterized cupin superfamily protein
VQRANIFAAQFEYDDSDPPGYQAGVAPVGRLAGGEALAVKLYEVPAGECLCPYHYEYEEEWLIVLDGEVELRVPDGDHQLEKGDVVRFAPGPAGAHKVRNDSDAVARLLMFSSAREPAVSVYPDSDKIGVWPGDERDSVMIRRADGNVDYYEGER